MIGAESEGLRGGIWAQLRNSDTPSTTVLEKTQDGVPSCVDTRYAGKSRTVKLHHLLLFDGAGNVVDYEDQEARVALISVGLIIPRKNIPTSLGGHPRMQREGDQGSFP